MGISALLPALPVIEGALEEPEPEPEEAPLPPSELEQWALRSAALGDAQYPLEPELPELPRFEGLAPAPAPMACQTDDLPELHDTKAKTKGAGAGEEDDDDVPAWKKMLGKNKKKSNNQRADLEAKFGGASPARRRPPTCPTPRTSAQIPSKRYRVTETHPPTHPQPTRPPWLP
jgi:hypothetical protein